MTIVGRIGSDYSEFTSLNNNRYIRYSIASQPRRDSPTNWYNITVFNENQINFLTNYVRKGYVSLDLAFTLFFFSFPTITNNSFAHVQHISDTLFSFVSYYSMILFFFFIFFCLLSALVYVEADAANFVYEKEDGTRGTRLSLVQKEISLLKNASKPEDTAAAPASATNQEVES